MFSDQPVTPLRLETLVDVVFEFASGSALERDTLAHLLQPDGLPGLSDSRGATTHTLRAATDLALVEEVDGALRPAAHLRPRPPGRAARTMVLAALDERVLSATQVEPWLALFYSFLLGKNARGAVRRDPQEWVEEFHRVVFDGELPKNPLNKTKVSGLWRWLTYMGLGWTDVAGVFQCNPRDRLARAIPAIFGNGTRLEADAFMARLAEACPELDGGAIFRQANPGIDVAHRVCTLGLAQALLELHEDATLVLHCPPDSQGWSIELAEPTRDAAILRSERVSVVELRRHAGGAP